MLHCRLNLKRWTIHAIPSGVFDRKSGHAPIRRQTTLSTFAARCRQRAVARHAALRGQVPPVAVRSAVRHPLRPGRGQGAVPFCGLRNRHPARQDGGIA
ncbi:hypothetical protein [Azospirillum melinis]